MIVTPAAIPDVLIIDPVIYGDARGFFLESWNARVFAEAGLPASFVQDNQSRSRQYTLRGLHYQLVEPQGKLVRCVRGEIADVAVDLRRSSKTFGQHVVTRLSDENQHQIWIPPGYAHGFCVLSETADVLYKCTAYYAPLHERVLAWNDPALCIDWGLPKGVEPMVSTRDAGGYTLAEAEVYE